MKLSILGKIIHFYFWSGRFLLKFIVTLGLLLLISGAVIVLVPQFAMHKEGFVISSNLLLAIAQVLVGITFFISFFGTILLGAIVIFWFFPEIVCELIFKKKVIRVVKERQKILLSDLAKEVGAYEEDLGTLLKNWIGIYKFNIDPTKRSISGHHLSISLDTKEVSWE